MLETSNRPILPLQVKESTPTNDEIDLLEVLRTIWRGKLLIIATCIITVALGVWYAFFHAVPEYTATSIVTLESRQENVTDMASVITGLSGDQPTINTEVEVLKSRKLIEKLVLDLDLLDDPEFNSTLRPEPQFSIGKGVRYIRALIHGPEVQPKLSDRAILEKVIDNVSETLAISNVRQSYVFRIQAKSESSQKAADIANRLAELYIQDQITVKFDKTEQAAVWLSERVSELQIELENAEGKLKDYTSNINLISPEGLTALNRQLKEMRDRRTVLEKGRQAQREKAAQLARLNSDGPDEALITALNNASLSAAFADLQAGRSDAMANFKRRTQQLLDRARFDGKRAEDQVAALNGSIAEAERQIETQSQELVKLQQLQREAEANRILYEAFLSRLKETSIQQGIQQADSRILSNAAVPTAPTAPRKALILALSLMLGLFLGVAIVVLRELSQNTFRAPETLESRTGYSVLGKLPIIPARRRKRVLKYLAERHNSAAVEAIRDLRTSLLLSSLDKEPQVIMSTSSIPGEGKTTTSLALSQNLAGLGKKVLLVEGDIRRRTFGQYFDLSERKGILSVLSGDATLEEAVYHEEMLNIDLLCGEKSTINAADVFSSARFTQFLQDLRKVYDYIVIDTPPVLAVPDARVIGQKVDAILYSVKWDSTTHRQVIEGLRAFENVNVKVTGLVLGQIDPKGMRRYGYQDGYQSYGAYYDT
ncbi:GumC family protein [Aquicoccus sp. G2-2]|uniref:GumC family protein n=1 Tax=Aquicoccus sp. G2-2 TaxID=3092120 RepID=UPI002AE02D9E|nr:polysaccharide biosynthesis tyrosine autokinase [Aquicoccus sp. G2-2]MEA1115084.1 polysaccharide biosynthesis tyrosine autokinase [Aquicoccus sp. G2-2]